MEELKTIIENLIGGMGFEDFSVSLDTEGNRFSILIKEERLIERFLPDFILDFNFIVKLVCRKNDWPTVVVDVNNYRKQRQELIVELARAAARKAVATKEEIVLPPMNAFERRLIHTELMGRPDLKTESAGEDRERHVVVKPI